MVHTYLAVAGYQYSRLQFAYPQVTILNSQNIVPLGQLPGVYVNMYAGACQVPSFW